MKSMKFGGQNKVHIWGHKKSPAITHTNPTWHLEISDMGLLYHTQLAPLMKLRGSWKYHSFKFCKWLLTLEKCKKKKSIYGIFYSIYANTTSQKLQELAYLKDMQVLWHIRRLHQVALLQDWLLVNRDHILDNMQQMGSNWCKWETYCYRNAVCLCAHSCVVTRTGFPEL